MRLRKDVKVADVNVCLKKEEMESEKSERYLYSLVRAKLYCRLAGQ